MSSSSSSSTSSSSDDIHRRGPSSSYVSSTTTSTTNEDDVGGDEPFNFSWVLPGHLAACGFPGRETHLRWLVNAGVNILVTLNVERKPPVDAFRRRAALEWLCVDIVDFATPTRRQIDQVLEAMSEAEKDGKKICVHCTMGRGRTGTMIACWLAQRRNLTGEEAIGLTRKLRPGSIETVGQEQAIVEFAKNKSEK